MEIDSFFAPALRRLRQCQTYQNLEPDGGAFKEHAAYLAKFNGNVHLYWIDAVCIDQKDLRERSTQGSLMSQIYRPGQCTVVWYGEVDTYTKPALQVLQKISGLSSRSGSS